MPRKKRTRAAQQPVGRVRTITDEPILPDEQEDDPFAFALEEFGADEVLSLQVYRYDPMTAKARYVKSVPFQKEIHGLEWLQRMFGAGDYLLRFYDSEGKSKNRRVSIDDDPASARARREPEPSSGRDELVSLLREQNQIFLTALVKNGPAVSAGSSASENPILMKILDAVLPQAFSKPDMTTPLLSMLEKGISIAMEAKTENEGGMAGLVRSVAREIGPVLQEWARAQMYRAPTGPPARSAPSFPTLPAGVPAPPGGTAPPTSSSPASPAPNPTAPPSSPAPAPMSLDDSARSMVEGTVAFVSEVIERAWQAKEKPEDVADYILGEIPANYHEHLSGLSYDRVKEINPRYGNIERAWLEQLIGHLQTEATGGEPNDQDGAEEEGDHGSPR